MKKALKKISAVFLIAAVALITFSGCRLMKKDEIKDLKEEIREETKEELKEEILEELEGDENNEVEGDEGEMETYTNETYGFQIDIPESWDIAQTETTHDLETQQFNVDTDGETMFVLKVYTNENYKEQSENADGPFGVLLDSNDNYSFVSAEVQTHQSDEMYEDVVDSFKAVGGEEETSDCYNNYTVEGATFEYPCEWDIRDTGASSIVTSPDQKAEFHYPGPDIGGWDKISESTTTVNGQEKSMTSIKTDDLNGVIIDLGSDLNEYGSKIFYQYEDDKYVNELEKMVSTFKY